MLTLSNVAFYEIKTTEKTKHISYSYPKGIAEFTDARLDALISQITDEFDAKLLDYEISVIFK